MISEQHCTIGTVGEKWSNNEKAQWLEQQSIKRSYQEEVLNKLDALNSGLSLKQFGSLSYGSSQYPLFVIKTSDWNDDNETILVTGGVHGYETSGVQGAIRFAMTKAMSFSSKFNLVIAPCVSPWGYETINRWNPDAIDPNRSFRAESPAGECAQLMNYLSSLQLDFRAHFDLHETTDTDNSRFRPEQAARDGIVQSNWSIPDGFYLVGDSARPAAEFQKAMVKSVEQVTHIAPPDEDGKLIDVTLEQWGVVNYPARQAGLCMGMTDSAFVTTTEVYPDSPKVNDENCILAQVAAVSGGLDYLLSLSEN